MLRYFNCATFTQLPILSCSLTDSSKILIKCFTFCSSFQNLTLHKKWSFPLRIFSVSVTKLQFPEDMVTLTEEILHEKTQFLCSVSIKKREKPHKILPTGKNSNKNLWGYDCRHKIDFLLLNWKSYKVAFRTYLTRIIPMVSLHSLPL